MEIDLNCPKCGKRVNTIVKPGHSTVSCPHCESSILSNQTDEFKARLTLNQCPCCGCAHLYKQRDFNRTLGIALLVLGIALAYFTYGISILVLTAIDFYLYKTVGDVGCCYLCGAVYRSKRQVAELNDFDLEMHDYYKKSKRNLKPNPPAAMLTD